MYDGVVVNVGTVRGESNIFPFVEETLESEGFTLSRTKTDMWSVNLVIEGKEIRISDHSGEK